MKPSKRKIAYTIASLVLFQLLLSCAGNPAKTESIIIGSSHSVYIGGGVLKILSEAGGKDILYIYVRPEQPGYWVVAGGGGGNQTSPWRYASMMSWALADEEGWFNADASRREFSCLFDSRNMTLTMERGTYAVNKGDFIVVTLDENWQPSRVKSGLSHLKLFDMPDPEKKHLLSEARKYMTSGIR